MKFKCLLDGVNVRRTRWAGIYRPKGSAAGLTTLRTGMRRECAMGIIG